MNFSEIAQRLGKYAADNSPAILTGVAVIGTVTTAYLTGKASFKAAQILHQWDWDAEDPNKGNTLKNKEKVELVWKLYVPAAGTAALTIAAIICSNRISDRRAAALAGAYSLAQRGLEEYRAKVVEKIGAPKEREIRDEVAKERIERAVAEAPRTVVIAGAGKVTFRDHFSGDFFETTITKVEQAVNTINFRILNHNYASVNDFYELIGLPTRGLGEEFGWSSPRQLEIDTPATKVEIDGNEVPIFELYFEVEPLRGYSKIYP